LPAELWLIIFDMLISTGITLLEQCDHTTFPDIDTYLDSPPARAAPFDNSYGQLRLVCRTFHALLGGSPHYIMKLSHDSIPSSARALYFVNKDTTSRHVRRLLGEPLISHRLLHLDACFGHSNGQIDLELLCANPGSFPNLRCLTLRLARLWENPKAPFWALLNDAFPLLRRLVLIHYHRHSDNVKWEFDGGITFRNLEFLSLSWGIRCFSGLRFPFLRHLAASALVSSELSALGPSPLLESALFFHALFGSSIDLHLFPRLRLLGVPQRKVDLILPLGDDHPLEHLWLYYSKPSDSGIESIVQVPKKLPGVSRITVDTFAAKTAELKMELRRCDGVV
jgi:hypothetical protein